MTNRILEIQKRLQQKYQGSDNKVSILPFASGSQSLSPSRLVLSNETRRTYPVVPNFRARALSIPVDFDVPRSITPIRKPSPMTCWAAAAAMLASYKEDGKLVSVEETARRAGGRYEGLLQSDAALTKADMADYLSALGLSSGPAVELAIDQVHQMLRRFGAVWLTPNYDPAFSLDARIVTGIHGDGTPSGTEVALLDPNNGAKASVPFDRLGNVFQRQGPIKQMGQMIVIHWPPDTLGAAIPQGMSINNALSFKNKQPSGQHGFPISRKYEYHSPSDTVSEQSIYSMAQNLAAILAGLNVADAAGIGLATIAVVQAQVAASQGSFTLLYDKAQRLLTAEARAQMPGAQTSKKSYSHHLFYIGIGAVNAAQADVLIEWEGNPYGEIGTPVIGRNLKTSTEWSKSSANITITRVERIPPPKTDPRAWPIVYSYEGTYDPWGNGYFEFKGEFEINAFGGLKFNKHEVVSRSLADWAIEGNPEDYVQKGKDVNVPVPSIPQEQIDYLKTKLP